jgi:hypothetical protein
MSDLQNLTPANTYKGLLQVGDYTNGVDSTVKAVLDGEGTTSALAIGTTKVGINTTSPTQELDVSGNVVADEYALDQTGTSSSAVAIHAPATNELAIRTNSTEAMRIDSLGSVGLGTTNTAMPSGKGINIYDTNVARVNLKNSTTGDGVNDGITMSLNANGDFFIYNKETTGLIQLGTNSTTHVTLDENGNFGIGAISPSAPLEVASTTGGVIMPRMTTTQMNAITSPTDGEMIYNTTENKFYGRANGAWTALH